MQQLDANMNSVLQALLDSRETLASLEQAASLGSLEPQVSQEPQASLAQQVTRSCLHS